MKQSLKIPASASFHLLSCVLLLFLSPANAQSSLWTEKDRLFLLENLERTRDEFIKETENLTLEQWSFKANDSSWSIAQVVEHMGIYERTFLYETWIILLTPQEPELAENARSDSTYLAWMNEPKPHKADIIHTPLGLMEGKDNLSWFLYGRNILIEFIHETPADLKSYYTYRWGDERRSIHSLFVVHFGHTDRHLRQIERIKLHDDFPQ